MAKAASSSEMSEHIRQTHGFIPDSRRKFNQQALSSKGLITYKEHDPVWSAHSRSLISAPVTELETSVQCSKEPTNGPHMQAHKLTPSFL
jgi:hypothetical protein